MSVARLTIGKKIVLGYIATGIFTIIVAAYAISSLGRLSSLSSSIVTKDFTVIETVKRMEDSLLAQDFYEKRYLILKDPAIKKIFTERGEEFKRGVLRLQSIYGKESAPMPNIIKLHGEYEELFREEAAHIEKKRDGIAARISEEKLKPRVDELFRLLQGLADEARVSQETKLQLVNKVGERAFSITIILSLLSLIVGIIFTTFITLNISASIEELKRATEFIGAGKFDHVPKINARDEVGDLAESFKRMSQRLKTLEEVNLDASPLTRLPGNLAIEKELLSRIVSGEQFAFCYLDLDNFKPFSDTYGYARGSEVIKETADIIKAVAGELGDKKDFVGHIGGDDYVMITEPKKVSLLCNEIISRFDKSIIKFYNKDDLERGYIVSVNREDIKQNFPIMTISIAVVTNEKRHLSSALQVAEIAAELKHYAKTIPKSIYVVDQRRILLS
ncbi:MAG: diguanylate cyclase [Nitrospirota bacterium]|mgnify:FL=1|jgi:diguanylate cyclase (GGDEF)-like protein